MPSTERRPADRARRQVPHRRRRLHHRRSASTRAPANTGTHVGHLWTRDGHAARRRRPSPARPRPAGSRSTLRRRRSPITAEHDLRRLVLTRRSATTRSTDGYFAGRGVDNAPLHALADGADGAERRLHVRRRAAFPTSTFNSDATTGSTSSSRRRRPGHDAADGHHASRPANGAPASPPATDRDARRSTSRWTRRRSRAPRSSCATRRTRSSPATVTYDAGTRTATLTPTGAARALDDLHRDRARRRRPASRTPPATRWPPTSPGRSRRPRRRHRRPTTGPGGPILVVTSAANPFSRYYAEILRAEGLNAFAVDRHRHVTAATLAGYDVVDPRRDAADRGPGRRCSPTGSTPAAT